MEIAKLDVLLGADIKPLTAALNQAKASIDQFASTGADAFLNLNAGLSTTAKAALAAGTDIRSLTAALDVLQAEQQNIVRGTTQWSLYEQEIRRVNVQLDVLEAQLPVVAKESAVAASSIGGIGKGLTGAFSGLRQIAYILPGIGIAGLFNLAFEAIMKAADALKIFNSDAKQLADATTKSIEGLSDEANKVNILVGELQSENVARESKQRIIKELQSLAPAYFSNLKLEGDTIIGIVDDYAKYTTALGLVAKIRAATDLNQKNVTAEIEQELKVSQQLLFIEQNKAKFLDYNAARARVFNEDLFERVKLYKQEKPLLDIIIEAQKELDSLGGNPLDKPQGGGGIKDLKKSTDETVVAIKRIPPEIAIVLSSLGDVNKELTQTPALMNQIKDVDFQKIIAADKAAADLKKMNEQLKLANEVSQVLAQAFTEIFVDLITQGKVNFRHLETELVRFIAKLGEAVLQAFLLKTILAALSGGFGSLTSIGAALGNNILLPHLASGGIVSSPTTALIGESGPEAVIPLDKISQLFGSIGGSNIQISGELRAHGTDLVVALNRGNVRINRNYGSNFTN